MNNNIINSNLIENNQFFPLNDITRSEVAVYISMLIPDAEKKEMTFIDLSSVAAYVSDAIQIAYDNEIMIGVDDARFEPYRNLTRAEASTVLKKLLLILSK